MRLSLTITALAAVVAVLAAPVAQADPARHMHDYLAAVRQARVSAIPPDVRDHAQIKQLVARYGNRSALTTTSPASSFSWGDAGIGAGVTAGTILLLGAAATLTVRRRSRLAL